MIFKVLHSVVVSLIAFDARISYYSNREKMFKDSNKSVRLLFRMFNGSNKYIGTLSVNLVFLFTASGM